MGHYVGNTAGEFLSLEYDVTECAISQKEADRILSLAPKMTGAKDALNFCRARKELRVTTYRKLIQRVAGKK